MLSVRDGRPSSSLTGHRRFATPTGSSFSRKRKSWKGTHDGLLAHGRVYRSLIAAQTEAAHRVHRLGTLPAAYPVANRNENDYHLRLLFLSFQPASD